MYHYGGGYSDIKSTSDSWIKCFDDLQRDTNVYAIGYNCDRIPSKCDAGENYDIELHNNLMLNIKNLIGVGFFIFKKNTSLVNEWWLELNNRLDFFYDELKKILQNMTEKANAVRQYHDGKGESLIQIILFIGIIF